MSTGHGKFFSGAKKKKKRKKSKENLRNSWNMIKLTIYTSGESQKGRERKDQKAYSKKECKKGIERKLLNLIKTTKKPIANIKLNCEKFTVF